jgi:hypothetical protein
MQEVFMMKAKLKLVSVAMLGFIISGMLLAGISARAESVVKSPRSALSIPRWDGGRGHI